MYMQAEARFRAELESVNVTVASRMFRTEDNPIETADLFVSVMVVEYLIIFWVSMFRKLSFLSGRK